MKRIPWIVKGYFQPSQWTEEAKTQLDEQLKELESYGLQTGPLTVRVSEVEKRDWATAWKQYCFPVRVTLLFNSCS